MIFSFLNHVASPVIYDVYCWHPDGKLKGIIGLNSLSHLKQKCPRIFYLYKYGISMWFDSVDVTISIVYCTTQILIFQCLV